MRATSPFQCMAVVTKVAIEPCKLEFSAAAIKEKLNLALFKYSDDVDGVPIAYENVKFLPGMNCARVFGESPWLHIEVLMDMIVFKPAVGQRTFGRVSTASATHISVLIYGMFNAMVSAEMLCNHFSFDKGHMRWENDSDVIEEGSLVEFSIVSCNQSQGVYFLHGSDVVV